MDYDNEPLKDSLAFGSTAASQDSLGSLKLQSLLDVINEIYEIEKKQQKIQESNSIKRNITNIYTILNNIYADKSGIYIHNPMGEKYDVTRYDCDASIAGESTNNLVIVDVIKPIVSIKINDRTKIIQRGVVVVKDREKKDI